MRLRWLGLLLKENRIIAALTPIPYNRQQLHSALKYLTPSEFEQKQNAVEDDRAMEGAENETPCFPPLPQLLEIPGGFPHLPQRDGET